MKTRYKIIILIIGIPVGLFAAVFFGATIMSLTNTGYYYTPTEKELPTKTMIELANALPVTQVFREKYPDSEPLVDRASSFGVHYQAYPEKDSPKDPNFDYDERNPYVALVIPFTDDKVVGISYIYCVQNYVRSERIYEQDNSRFYKVQSHEDIINYLQNESCFLTKEMVSKALEDPCPISYMDKDNAKTVRIPSRLDQFGLAYTKQVWTFEQAKNLIGIENVSLPEYVPDCLLKQTIWVSDTDNTFIKKFVVIYVLDKYLDSNRNTLHEYENDGLTIVYRDVVKGEPYQRMKKIDEGFYLELIPRNPEKYGGAGINAVIDDTWIQLKSKILDLPELEKIVYSIPR